MKMKTAGRISGFFKQSTIRFTVLLLAWLALAGVAQAGGAKTKPAPRLSALQVSLATTGYQFDVVHYYSFTNIIVDPTNPIALPLAATTIPQEPLVPIVTPLGFGANFILKNNTSAPLTVVFPWAYWAANKIVFTVYDANDAVVWTSAPIPVDVPPLAQPVSLTLGAGQSWSQTVFVPLVLAGGALPDGNYRLEATVTGTPAFSANAAFAVQNLYAGPVIVDPPVVLPATR
jgi:hypothetical protein